MGNDARTKPEEIGTTRDLTFEDVVGLLEAWKSGEATLEEVKAFARHIRTLEGPGTDRPDSPRYPRFHERSALFDVVELLDHADAIPTLQRDVPRLLDGLRIAKDDPERASEHFETYWDEIEREARRARGSLPIRERVVAALARAYDVPADEVDGEEQFLSTFGRPREALLYVPLFCPRTALIEDSMVLAEWAATEAARQSFLSVLDRSGPEAAEREFNWIELPRMLSVHDDFYVDEYELLAEAVRASWVAWLPSRYPGREFQIEIEPFKETGEEISLRFFQSNREKPSADPRNED